MCVCVYIGYIYIYGEGGERGREQVKGKIIANYNSKTELDWKYIYGACHKIHFIYLLTLTVILKDSLLTLNHILTDTELFRGAVCRRTLFIYHPANLLTLAFIL